MLQGCDLSVISTESCESPVWGLGCCFLLNKVKWDLWALFRGRRLLCCRGEGICCCGHPVSALAAGRVVWDRLSGAVSVRKQAGSCPGSQIRSGGMEMALGWCLLLPSSSAAAQRAVGGCCSTSTATALRALLSSLSAALRLSSSCRAFSLAACQRGCTQLSQISSG